MSQLYPIHQPKKKKKAQSIKPTHLTFLFLFLLFKELNLTQRTFLPNPAQFKKKKIPNIPDP
jgi:hypothetical protein